MLPIYGNAGWRWEQPQELGVNGFGEVQRVVVLQITRGYDYHQHQQLHHRAAGG